MSKVLVVKAHPFNEDKSSTITVLNAFMNAYQAAHTDDEIEVIDLYNTEIPEVDGDLLNAWADLKAGTEFTELSSAQQEAVQAFDQMTQQFLDADKIVIANPIWNLMIPARLKLWMDTITVAGKTFRYVPDGVLGLAKGKKVVHIQSSGSPFGGQDPATKYLEAILGFIGIDDIEHILIDGKDAVPADKAQEMIQAASAKAEQTAKEF